MNSETKTVKENIEGKLYRHFGRTPQDATKLQLYKAVSLCVRDELMQRWQQSVSQTEKSKSKVLYYLSLEFLMGRFLSSNLLALGKQQQYADALAAMGLSYEDIEDVEQDAGLGNGGLGRLAACFMDSLATLDMPAIGCGIRYDYGLFRQRIIDGQQIEMPDDWLSGGCSWEIERIEEQFTVEYYGNVVEYFDNNGRMCHRLENTNKVLAVPYDIPIPGYGCKRVNTLRIFSAAPLHSFDMGVFGQGDYVRAVAERDLAETISRVLYPNDSHNAGKSLRLQQQYFFTSATMQYMIARHKKLHLPLSELDKYAAVQINDTHPAIAIAELMRLLMDNEGMGWDEAFGICRRVFSYTNHTIMSEALEKWPCYLVENMLPRIYMIIKEIDRRWREQIPWDKGDSMGILAYSQVRMANLCMAVCNHVNGVSALHSQILRDSLFADYSARDPQQIVSVTNGITPRRWLLQANPDLAALLDEKLGTRAWVTNMPLIAKLERFADDEKLLARVADIKQRNKQRLAQYILKHNNIQVDPDSIFDIQVKRLHEYKRQLLNALHILSLYFDIVENGVQHKPRTFVFGAKASPGYVRAKQTISLICAIADLVNNDPRVQGRLKVVFIENYGVSNAQIIIPAADISEQISLAGKEASGTGNMKFMMNGALTVGTLDGANVEMRDILGDDNIFIFGKTAPEIAAISRAGSYDPVKIYNEDPTVRRVVDALADGTLPPSVASMKDYLLHGDNPDCYYCLLDFHSYRYIQQQAEQLYGSSEWRRRSLINIARSHFFSSDRAINEYNEKIWHLTDNK